VSGSGREIVLATRSGGKIRELIPMVRAAGFVPLTLETLGIGEVPEEEGIEVFDTFEENALAKARWFSARAAGRLVLADDSGLAIDALGGAPGVRSKRWSGIPALSGQALDDANNAKMLRELQAHASRRARYVSVVAIAAQGREVIARGECVGAMLAAPRGQAGFGYDPYFLSDELGMSFGEASIEAKERVSHRGRAVRAALEKLSRAVEWKKLRVDVDRIGGAD
jgi:XTP/dITP diphosphohydrolase